MNYNVKQVIVFRKDLKMRAGKIAAQCAHASMAVFFNMMEAEYSGEDGNKDECRHDSMRSCEKCNDCDFTDRVNFSITLSEDRKNHKEIYRWMRGSFAKIVLSVDTEDELDLIYELAKKYKLPCSQIIDAGNTEFHGVPTKTAIAIGPAGCEEIDKITGPNGTIKCKLA